MFQEVTVEYNKELDNGKEKTVKEQYITDNVTLCSESENRMMELFNNECEVVSIKRSSIKEFVNEAHEDRAVEDLIYKAKLTSIFVKDDGSEKETHYTIAIWEADLNEANNILKEYVKQGMQDLRIDGINKTKFIDLIK